MMKTVVNVTHALTVPTQAFTEIEVLSNITKEETQKKINTTKLNMPTLEVFKDE